jgi:hypothetical protein
VSESIVSADRLSLSSRARDPRAAPLEWKRTAYWRSWKSKTGLGLGFGLGLGCSSPYGAHCGQRLESDARAPWGAICLKENESARIQVSRARARTRARARFSVRSAEEDMYTHVWPERLGRLCAAPAPDIRSCQPLTQPLPEWKLPQVKRTLLAGRGARAPEPHLCRFSSASSRRRQGCLRAAAGEPALRGWRSGQSPSFPAFTAKFQSAPSSIDARRPRRGRRAEGKGSGLRYS